MSTRVHSDKHGFWLPCDGRFVALGEKTVLDVKFFVCFDVFALPT